MFFKERRHVAALMGTRHTADGDRRSASEGTVTPTGAVRTAPDFYLIVLIRLIIIF